MFRFIWPFGLVTVCIIIGVTPTNVITDLLPLSQLVAPQILEEK
jgi:hypothetical protein